MREAAAPGDRADAEDRTAARRREADDVCAYLRILRAAQPREVEQDLLDDVRVVVAVPFGARDQERVRRRAEGELVAVELVAGSAAADQAEVADALRPLDSREDPRGSRVETVGHTEVVRRTVEALGREADAEDLLRRTGAVAPDATALAARRVVGFARARLPCA